MLKKEIADTLKTCGFALLVGIFVLLFTYFLINIATEDGISLNELLCTSFEFALLGLALVLGSSLFASEKKNNSFLGSMNH